MDILKGNELIATYDEKQKILTAEKKLTPKDFHIIAESLKVEPGYAKKIADKPTAYMRIVNAPEEMVRTYNDDGSKQAVNTARLGDAVLTRINPVGEFIESD